MPTLLIDDEPFTEAAALLITLAMRHPQSGLLPPENPKARAEWYQWIVYLTNTLQPSFRLWFYPTDLAENADDLELIKAGARRKIESVWSRIDTHLATQGKDGYLLGPTFSAADLMLIMLMRWSRNMPKPATEWTALRAYVNLMRSRPSWAQLYALEGLSEWT